MAEIIKVNPEQPEENLILKAVDMLESGGVIAYPTETFYALGAHAGNRSSVEKIFRIKRRAFNKPIALIIGKQEELEKYVSFIPPVAERLMKTFWPGALTLIFQATAMVDPLLTAKTGKIGFRVSSHPVATALARHLGFPVTATSANISGEGECITALMVDERLGTEIDVVIDGGKTWGGVGSTILDVTVDPPSLIREGNIPYDLLRTIWANSLSSGRL